MKADKIKLALEKLKEAKVKKVRWLNIAPLILHLQATVKFKDIVNYSDLVTALKDYRVTCNVQTLYDSLFPC